MSRNTRLRTDLSRGDRQRLRGIVQLSLIANVVIIAFIASRTFDRSTSVAVLVITAALVLVSVLAVTIPWRRLDRRAPILIAVLDLVVIGALRVVLFDYQRGLVVLAIIPVVWLSFQFGKGAVAIGILGSYVIAVLPFVITGSWTASATDWGTILTSASTITVVGIAVHSAALALRKQNLRLRNAYADLRRSVASDLAGAEKLRDTVAAGASNAAALKMSVAFGMDSADKLRDAVASDANKTEALRLAVSDSQDATSAALAVMNTVEAGITFFAPDGSVIFANAAAGELAALEDDQPVDGMDEVLARAAAGDLVTRHAFTVGNGPERRAILATSKFVRREAGEMFGTVVATTDITALTNAIRDRDEFLQTVSHELRTPLTSILGYLELIDDAIDVEQAGVGEEFSVVLRNSNRLLGLVDDLLRTAAADMPLYRRSVDVTALSKRAFELIGPAAERANIRLSPFVAAPVYAEIDEHQIGDVIEKLLSNAIKFNRPGGAISLAVDHHGQDVDIIVTDTGYGLDDSDRAHIFERFFHGSSSRATIIAGAGLGLSTAKLIIDSHHGSLNAESVNGEGTTVTVRLPLVVA